LNARHELDSDLKLNAVPRELRSRGRRTISAVRAGVPFVAGGFTEELE
jgi:hypothetical protein